MKLLVFLKAILVVHLYLQTGARLVDMGSVS